MIKLRQNLNPVKLPMQLRVEQTVVFQGIGISKIWGFHLLFLSVLLWVVVHQTNRKEDTGDHRNKDTIQEDRKDNQDGEQGHKRSCTDSGRQIY